MTPREQVERLQRQGRAVLDRTHALHLPDDLDETFYEALRESLVLAHQERLTQFGLIADHLACTKVRICLNQADTLPSVEFPNRSRLH
jgi:hypothetical protein